MRDHWTELTITNGLWPESTFDIKIIPTKTLDCPLQCSHIDGSQLLKTHHLCVTLPEYAARTARFPLATNNKSRNIKELLQTVHWYFTKQRSWYLQKSRHSQGKSIYFVCSVSHKSVFLLTNN